jgi:enoyl-CoA hydratase
VSWQIDLVDRVAVVTMNTNKANAQNEQFFLDLHEAFDRLDRQPPAAGIVLTGQGSIFSAGLDLKYTLPLFATGDQTAVRDWFQRYRATNMRLFTYPRPTVAAINGHAFAGGVITALCCDYRIAADGPARLALNETLIGIAMPAVYEEIIRYAIGTPNATVATLFGEEYDVSGARRIGFVHQTVSPDQLLEAAIARADMIPVDAVAAYAGAKRGLQAPALANIRSAETLDADLVAALTDPGNLRAQREKYRLLTGRELTPASRQ